MLLRSLFFGDKSLVEDAELLLYALRQSGLGLVTSLAVFDLLFEEPGSLCKYVLLLLLVLLPVPYN